MQQLTPRLRAVLAVAMGLSLGAPASDALAQARKSPAAKPPAKAAAAPKPPPPPPQPPAPPPQPGLVAICSGEALKAPPPAKGGVRGMIGGGLARIGSTTIDRFSISGRDGVFLCSPGQAAQATERAARPEPAPAATKTTTPGGGPAVLSLSAQADVRGDMRPTLFQMNQTQARLQAMVDRLAKAWPYPNAPRPRVLISANLAYNAEARPDNTLTVWLGVFEGTTPGTLTDQLTDNDLYWLLGHEYAHLALGHSRRDEAAEGQRKLLQSMTSLYQRGAVLEANMRYAEPGVNADMRERIEDSKEAHRRLRFLVDKIAMPFWGRMLEDEADAAGYDVAALAGYQPRWSYSTTQFALGEKAMDDRVDAVKSGLSKKASALLADPQYQAALNQGQFSAAANTMGEALKKSLIEETKSQAIDWMSRDHRSAKARSEGMERYRQAAYDRTQITPASGKIVAETTGLMSLTELAEAVRAARAASNAENALDPVQGEDPQVSYAKAASEIQIALNTPFKREAYIRLVAARVALAQNRPGDAVNHLEAARSSPNVSPDAYRELARLYAKRGSLAQAQTIVTEGRSKTGDYDYFLPEDVRILVRGHKFKEAGPVIGKCRASQREQIILDCLDALSDLDQSKLTEQQKQQFHDLAYWGATPKTAKDDQSVSPFDLRSLLKPASK